MMKTTYQYLKEVIDECIRRAERTPSLEVRAELWDFYGDLLDIQCNALRESIGPSPAVETPASTRGERSRTDALPQASVMARIPPLRSGGSTMIDERRSERDSA